jgi:hypothetical protein
MVPHVRYAVAVAVIGLSTQQSVNDVAVRSDGYSCVVNERSRAGIQACIDAVAGGPVGGIVTLPAGDYYLDGPVIVSYPYTAIRGAARGGTLITNMFRDGFAFEFRGPAGGSEIRDLYIYGYLPGASGIYAHDQTEFTIADVRIAVPGVGLHLVTRDSVSVDRVTVFASAPVYLGGDSAIVLDHAHFHDCYFVASDPAGAVVDIDADVRVQDLLFDGFAAWVGGRYGLRWGRASTPIGMSTRITLRGIRYEQSTGNGWTVHIDRDAYDHLAWLVMDGVTYARDAGGMYLRGVYDVDLRAPLWDGAPGYLWMDRAD